VTDLPEITAEMLDRLRHLAEVEGDADLPHSPEWEGTITPAVVLALIREVRVRGRALELAVRRDGIDCYGCALLNDDDGECLSDEGDAPSPQTCDVLLVTKFMREARAAEEAAK